MFRGIVFILVGLWLIIAFSGCMGSCLRHRCPLRGECSPPSQHGPCTADGNADCPQPDCDDDSCPISPDDECISGRPRLLPSWFAGSGRCAAEASQPQTCVAYLNHPRFHPVPTEPVFSPRDDLVPGGTAMICPEPEAFEAPSDPDEPTAPEPEVLKPEPVPAPPGTLLPDDPKAAVPRRLDALAESGWVFHPPTQPSPAQKPPVRTRQTTASNKATRVKR